MKKIKPLSISAIMTTAALCGCVDSNYDMSDIDTTVQVSVNDLTVPIKIDEISLKSIISDDDLEVIDGVYAYTRSGEFSMSSVSVPGVVVPARATAPITIPISLPGLPTHEGIIENKPITVPLPCTMTDYAYHAANVTPDLVKISKAACECDITVTLEIKGLPLRAQYTFSDVELQLPDNILECTVSGGEYVKENNVIKVNTTTAEPKVTIICHCTAIGFGADGINLMQTDHSIDLSGSVGLKSGSLTINFTDDPYIFAPEQIELAIGYTLGDITITSIDGAICKAIDSVNVPAIDITGLPDVLSQPGTNLVLSNPCLYMSVDNPMSVCGVYAEAGFDITSYHGEQTKTYTIDNPTFRIDAEPTDYMCFSPRMPSNPDAAFPGCSHVPFGQLSDILSGYGLPSTLQVKLTDPQLPSQTVSGFMLDHDYGQIKGAYKFVAPLQFGMGTQIVYSDQIDDWGEDVQKMTVTRLDITLSVTTDVPMKVNLIGYPLDKDGRSIDNVAITGAIIDANAQAQPLKISITGAVTGLDGIMFVARATAVEGEALSPSMKINLSNIRPCVTGYYTTEL